MAGSARSSVLGLRVFLLELVIGEGQSLLMRRGIRRRAATLEQSRHGATQRRQVLQFLLVDFGRSSRDWRCLSQKGRGLTRQTGGALTQRANC